MVTIGEMWHTGVMYLHTPLSDQYYIPITGAAAGGQVDNYTAVVMNPARGRLKKLSGTKTFDAGRVRMNNTFEWICYLSAAIETNLPNNRDGKWVIGGKEYFFIGYELIDEKRFMYKFILSEVE